MSVKEFIIYLMGIKDAYGNAGEEEMAAMVEHISTVASTIEVVKPM